MARKIKKLHLCVALTSSCSASDSDRTSALRLKETFAALDLVFLGGILRKKKKETGELLKNQEMVNGLYRHPVGKIIFFLKRKGAKSA
jgi:hypothetical protein